MITGIARGYAELDWTALGLVAAEEAGIHATRQSPPILRVASQQCSHKE
jgi:hypothetical protein